MKRTTRRKVTNGVLYAILVLAIVLAGAGVALHWCLLVVALVPWVTVVGYEVRGHRHNEEVLQALQ